MYGLPDVLEALVAQYAELLALAYDGFGDRAPFVEILKKGHGGGVHVRNSHAHRMLRDLEFMIRLLTRETERDMDKLR